MNNIFIDWGITKPHTLLVGQEESYKCLKSGCGLVSLAPFNAFLEAGCPHHLLYRLITEGCEVYLCSPKLVKALRGEQEKSDETDVHCIRRLWRENPDAFHRLSLPERKDLQLSILMLRYRYLTMDVTQIKARQKSYEREFGRKGIYSEVLEIMERKKREAFREAQRLMKDELEKVSDIKGVGGSLLLSLLTVAHPKKFPTLSRYLAYCGYKGTAWQNGKGKYHRLAKSFVWQMSKQTIRAKDEKFYTLYLKFKGDLRTKNPEYPNGKIHGMAMNRLSTFILKEIYTRFTT